MQNKEKIFFLFYPGAFTIAVRLKIKPFIDKINFFVSVGMNIALINGIKPNKWLHNNRCNYYFIMR